MKTDAIAKRICLTFPPLILVIAGTLSLWASEDSWEKHMKAGETAYARGLEEKFYYLGSSNPRALADFAKGEKEFLAALAIARTSSVKDLREAQTLGELAALSMDEGNFAEAEQRGNQSVASAEAAVGPDDPRMGVELANMALLYEIGSKPELAAPFWSRSAAILKKHGPVDSKWLSNFNARAVLMLTSHADKEQAFKFILEMEESTGAPEKDLRPFLSRLAAFQVGHDAEQSYVRLVEMDRKIYGPEGVETNEDMASLANVYTEEGKYAAAVPLLLHVLKGRQENTALYESEEGKSIDQYAILRLHKAKLEKSFYNSESGRLNRQLAGAYAETGHPTEAEAVLKQLLSAEEAETGPNLVLKNHFLTEDWIGLSRVYCEENRYDDALDALKQAEASNDVIEKSKFGKMGLNPGGPSVFVWNIQSERAEVYREKGDTAAAEPLFRSSLEMAQALMQQPVPMLPGNPPFARLLDHYARLLQEEGKTAEAETYYKRALDSWAKSRYPEHPNVAETLAGYAALLRGLHRAAEAEPLEERASAILNQVGAPNQVDR